MRSPSRRWSPPTLAALGLLWACAAHGVERGPHVQRVSGERAEIVWRGDGATGLTLHRPDGATRHPPPAADGRGRIRLSLDGLRPGTRYRYTLETENGPVDGRFHTPPPAGTPFTFAAYGDSRTDHRVHGTLAGRIAAADPDLVVHTGDLVTRGERDHEWAAFFEAAAPILRRAPLIPVLGNHDLDGDDPGRFFDHFTEPRERVYFAATWGNVRFLALDSEIAVVDGEGAPNAAQLEWMKAELARAAADPAIAHVVAFIHKGPYSGHPSRSGNLGLRAHLPALRAAGLSLIISGHDHYYERGTDAAGLPYLVLGGGGAPLYATRGPGERGGYTAHVSRPIYSFARLRVLPDRIEGCGVDLGGVPFDCFALKSPPRSAP